LTQVIQHLAVLRQVVQSAGFSVPGTGLLNLWFRNFDIVYPFCLLKSFESPVGHLYNLFSFV
jgi:hypothetical protein